MIFRSLLAILAAAALSACQSNAPQYQPGIENIDAASKLPGSIAVGKIEFEKGREAELNSVTARGSTFLSPVNGSYAEYIAKGLAEELRSAGKLDAASPNVLTGVIEKNDLAAAGMNTNDAELRVRFKLQNGSKVQYEKAITSKHEWESSFMGAIAIPRAIQNWVANVQKLLKQLYTDPQFASATAKK